MPRTNNATQSLVGRIPGTKTGRRPKANDELRICAEPTCTTKLNRYNPSDRCNVHRPTRFPAVRGRTKR